MRAVALTLCLTVTACFPTNPRARLYSKLTEGGLMAAGIAILSVVGTSADCKAMAGMPDSTCSSRESTYSDIGFGMILLGVVGFIATVSTTPDDKPDVAPIEIKAPVAPPVAAPLPPPPPPAPAPPPAPDTFGPSGGSNDPTEPVPN